MVSKKYNPHVTNILTIGLGLFILLMYSDVALSAWQPPIGIPAPSFGINETVDMYIGQQYTFTDGRGTINYPISPTSGKPYTHYIEHTHPNATDSGNIYGTPNKPRKTIPWDLPAGSVAEVHGGPYSDTGQPYGNYWFWFSGNGTQQKPVFIRGTLGDIPEFLGLAKLLSIRVGGSYVIIEDFNLNNANIGVSTIRPNSHHISMRNLEVHGGPVIHGTAVYAGVGKDIVIYNNYIHNNGDPNATVENDYHGASAGHINGYHAERVWIVDNHMHGNGGDSVQINSGNVPIQDVARYIYIGRNLMHDEGENAVDLKQCADVVVSQNTAYGFDPTQFASSGSDGTAMIIEDDHPHENIWLIFNKIYNSQNGIRVQDSGNIIGNIIYNIHNNAGYDPSAIWNGLYVGSCGIIAWGTTDLNVIGNTFYDVDSGIQYPGGGTGITVNIINNIISNLAQPTQHIGFGTSGAAINSEIRNNLLYQPGGSVKIIDYGALMSANINADPLFVDPANHDFHLQSTSPAIDAGTSSGIVQQMFDTFQTLYGIDIRHDMEGNPRIGIWDIGAYEGFSSDPNNPSPVLQAIGDKSVDENATLAFTINATDPNGEPITYYASSLPNGATLDPQNGDFTWTPSYSQAGSYSVTFRASDGNSYVSETITITVNNVNRAPVLGAINDKSVDENSLLSFSVNATDPDGQQLTYSVNGLPSGAVFASQTFTWTPSYNQAGTFAVTFTVDDGQVQDSEAITITVINVNRAPVLAAINNQSVWSDDPLSFTVSATDPDGDSVTYSANAIPSGATFITQTFNWTPTPAQIGTYNVTFIASDGQMQDSQAITISVNVDSLAPTITNLLPAAGAIQVPLNNLITLNVTDAGKGIDPTSVKIKLRINSNPNNDTIYFGDIDHDTSLLGDCQRIGTNANYQYVFQSTQDLFYYDQTVTITVEASDLAGNIMSPYIYSFVTEMHLFGQNKQVNTTSDNNNRPVTVCDSSGNIWAAWHTGSTGSRDIYVGKQVAGDNNFGSAVQLTNDTTDQCNPALALDSNDKLYAVWQDDREGDWDIYISTSVDGINWSSEIRVNDPNNGNQINPAIVIDSQSPNYAHVVWQDDRAGNQDICIASSNDGFITKTVSQITSDTSDQVEPAIAVDSSDTIYVMWTDNRNASSDIYGASSNSGSWTNIAIVNNANNQSSPAITAESTGTILHFLWVDDTSGNYDIYYASSNGLPGTPLTGSSIIDDTSGADQSEPAIAITGSTSTNDLKVFACWKDSRNADTDLYFTELNTGSGTNVFVNDGGSNAYQGEPAIGIDEDGSPYLIWSDDRTTNTNIYYAGSTSLAPVALASATVSASAPSTTIVGIDPQTITDIDDVSIVLPSGSCSYDVDVSIAEISNQQTFAAPCFGSYEFSPSGIQFNQPVTITIPYFYSASYGSTVPYWFNPLTGTLSQQGITNVRDIVISQTLHAVSFETTHFTPFYLLGDGGASAALGGGGGGGGCSVSAGNEGNIFEFALPYIFLAVVMAIIKLRDIRHHKLHII